MVEFRPLDDTGINYIVWIYKNKVHILVFYGIRGKQAEGSPGRIIPLMNLQI